LQIVLNKQEKERLVIKLHEEGKTIRKIAQQAHLSFTDIGAIIRKIDGRDNDDGIGANKDIRNKTRETKALWLFSNNINILTLLYVCVPLIRQDLVHGIVPQ
jgi:hypothetical protein